MQQPTFSQLDFYEEVAGKGLFGKWVRSGCVRRHPNPRYHKYYWWVFHRGSPCEAPGFLTKEHRLNEFEGQRLMRSLRKADQPYMLYNMQLPRYGIGVFDPNAKRWKEIEWAPAFNDDSDPECNGYK